MSTRPIPRYNLALGEAFHLYRYLDHFEPHPTVRLKISGAQFEATSKELTVVIPADIWETIRQCPATDFECETLTDEEISQRVDSLIDARAQKMEEAGPNVRLRNCRALAGMAVLGSGNLPREEQVRNGVKYFSDLRAFQQGVRAKMVQHETYFRENEPYEDDE